MITNSEGGQYHRTHIATVEGHRRDEAQHIT